VPNGAQVDSDGDGVGDACDPRPATNGDFIMAFEPHAGASTFYTFNGAASFQADALRLGTNTMTGQADFKLPGLPSRIATRMHVVTTQSTTLQWFGVWYSMDSGDSTKIFAEAQRDPPVGFVGYDLHETTMGAGSRYSTFTFGQPTYVVGDVIDFVIDTSLVTGGDDVMTVIDPQLVVRTHTLSIQIPRDLYGFLEAQANTIDYDYFIAYGIR
jgi:hypothetical protein